MHHDINFSIKQGEYNYNLSMSRFHLICRVNKFGIMHYLSFVNYNASYGIFSFAHKVFLCDDEPTLQPFYRCSYNERHVKILISVLIS